MTPEREEKLLSDVAEIKGQLKNYFDQVSPTFATKESVEAVDHRITEHVKDHGDNRNLRPVWIGLASSIVLGLASLAIAFVKKG